MKTIHTFLTCFLVTDLMHAGYFAVFSLENRESPPLRAPTGERKGHTWISSLPTISDIKKWVKMVHVMASRKHKLYQQQDTTTMTEFGSL